MDIQNVCTKAAAAFSTLSLHTYDYGPDAPLGNAVYVYPDEIEYGDTNTTSHVTLVIRFLIASTNSKGGQNLLNTLISTGVTGSAIDLIRTDNTLQGAVQSCLVVKMRKNGVVQMPDSTRYYSAELVLDAFV